MNGDVLVVDDDADTCELVTAFLSRENFGVASCTDGYAALELFARRKFDVVLADLTMPGMGGLRLCERVVDVCPTVRVVVFTGNACLETAVGAMRVGAYDFLTKPLDLRMVSSTVLRAVRAKPMVVVRALGSPEADSLSDVVAQSRAVPERCMPNLLTMDELEREHILRVLKLVDGNKSRAAHILGLDRRTLYRKLERFAVSRGVTPGPVAPKPD